LELDYHNEFIIFGERMTPRLPDFAKGEGCDALEEFKAFIGAMPEEAPHLLAELAYWLGEGSYEDIPKADRDATKITGLFCRKCGDWAVFYTAERKFFDITVVLAAPLGAKQFESLEAEAALRLHQLR
jgi:hypothetical protein